MSEAPCYALTFADKNYFLNALFSNFFNRTVYLILVHDSIILDFLLLFFPSCGAPSCNSTGIKVVSLAYCHCIYSCRLYEREHASALQIASKPTCGTVPRKMWNEKERAVRFFLLSAPFVAVFLLFLSLYVVWQTTRQESFVCNW